MGPNVAVRTADGSLRVEFEAAFFVPAIHRSLDERDGAAAFFETIEHAVGVTDRAFAELAFFGPHLLPAREVLANPPVNPPFLVAVAEEVIFVKDDAT